MSEQHQVNFNDLVNLAFDDGAVHIKHLQMLLKILVQQMNLGEVQVPSNDPNLIFMKNNVKEVKIDPVLKTIPRLTELMPQLCKDESNPIVDMLDLLNLTKRVEAVEISLLKITLLMEKVLQKESQMESLENVDNKSSSDSINEESNGTSSERISEGVMTVESSRSSAEDTERSSNVSAKVTQTSVSNNESQSEHRDIDDSLKQQVDAANQLITETTTNLSQSVCVIQTKIMMLQEQVEDLMFASEENELKTDETLRETNDFNSKIFCLKNDVKELLKESKELNEKLSVLDGKCETLSDVKTNKFYVDELFLQKAFKSDLEKLVPRDEFDPMCDILRLKFSLLEDTMKKTQQDLRKSLMCLKYEINEKMEKNELTKFKEVLLTSFDDFVTELKVLLYKLITNPVGIGGSRHLETNLNCISCESKVSMKKSVPDVPKLDPISSRFKIKMEKIKMPSSRPSSTAAIRKLLGDESKPKIPKKVNFNCFDIENLLSYPNTQPCFIISNDNSIHRADPLKCLNNPKYMKS